MFRNDLSAFITLNKMRGRSSAFELNKLKYHLKIKKAGFCGTLDPIAEGVLVVAFGKATRLISMITDSDKTYSGTMKLGFTSPSYDTDTEMTPTGIKPDISIAVISDIKTRFSGIITQTPPVYSALKINGKRACDLARNGETPEIKERTVTIHSIDLEHTGCDELSFRIKCSKGTYIRSIINDIGKLLGCGAIMQTLIRESVGDFSLKRSVSVSDLEKDPDSVDNAVTTIDEFLSGINSIDIEQAAYDHLRNGKEISDSGIQLFPGMNYIRFGNSPAFLLKKDGDNYSYLAYLGQ